MLNEQQFLLFGQIRTGQTGGRPYSDTSPYGKCSRVKMFIFGLSGSVSAYHDVVRVRIPSTTYTLY